MEMKLAYVMSSDKGDVNMLLAQMAINLQANDVRVVGTIQTNTPRPKSHKCDMDVRVLPDGKVIRISQNLGPNSRGCHLDPVALEQAVVETKARLAEADLLIVNKFGKHEAEGRGFRDVIAEAVINGIPVLMGTNSLNIEALEAFVGGEAERLEANMGALDNWVRRCVTKAA